MGGGPLDWPMRAAAILHGIKLDPVLSLPATACCPGGPTLFSLDGESYITELADGPPQAREYGDMTCLAAYFAPLNRMTIVWIGSEADKDAALSALAEETRNLTDWATVSPSYADWLARACAGAMT